MWAHMKSKLSTQNDKSIMEILKHQFYYKRSNPYSQKTKWFSISLFLKRKASSTNEERTFLNIHDSLNKNINKS